MSMPTLYEAKNSAGDVLLRMFTQVWSWLSKSRDRDKEGFDAEVGELIVTDLVPYCRDTASPKFTLADVASIESSGGKVLADEFADCVKAHIRYQTTLIEDPRVPADGIQYFTLAREQARGVLAQLENLQTTRQRPAHEAKPRNP